MTTQCNFGCTILAKGRHPLTGINGNIPVIVDYQDRDLEYRFQWRINAYGYAVANDDDGNEMRMNRVIMARILKRAVLPSEEVDHKEGDRLNNRRHMLRLATRSQQNCNRGLSKQNKTGYIGVSRKGNRFRADITVNGKRWCKLFMTAIEAAKARDAEARRHPECFFRLNKID